MTWIAFWHSSLTHFTLWTQSCIVCRVAHKASEILLRICFDTLYLTKVFHGKWKSAAAMELTFIGVNYNTSKKACPRPRCLKISEKVSFNIVRRATFTFWVDKSSLKKPKNGLCKLEADKSWWKMPKFQNSSGTFGVIFKHCDVLFYMEKNKRKKIREWVGVVVQQEVDFIVDSTNVAESSF